MPFKWDEEKEEILTEHLNYFSTGQNSFEIKLENFGAFPPRVIFICVQQSEFLISLQRNLQSFMRSNFKIFNSNYKEQAFHPHITLAFRDLKKRLFTKAWKEFENKKFHAQFKTANFSLLKHNGKNWQIHKTFKF
jgi:2'-5' RNA ligase